jgi:tight adherence protein B
MNSFVYILSENLLVVAVLLGAVGFIVYMQLQPDFGVNSTASARVKAITKSPVIENRRRRRMTADERRRQMIADGLRQVERGRTADPKSLDILIDQAGLTWSNRLFWTYSIVVGALLGMVATFVTSNPYIGLMMVAIGSYFPVRFYVRRVRKKRLQKFVDELPNALDMLVRGVKAGLHMTECFRSIARESKEPVRSEFQRVVEAQAIGITIADAIGRMADRVPTPETNFLAISVALQATSGGRLSEALENLSKTLRERKAMYGEIEAMSMEAKSSTAIIGAMPFLFIIGIHFTEPNYIMPLFQTTMGIVTILGAGTWMAIGLFIITKMSRIKV